MRLLRSILCGLAVAIATATGASSQPISPALQEQVKALLLEKNLRSSAERKISSRLLHADRQRRGLAMAIPSLWTGVQLARDGSVIVDVRTKAVVRVAQAILSLGGQPEFVSARFASVKARIPMAALRELAKIEEVLSIRAAARVYTRKLNTSEGDRAHGGDLARAEFGVDGSGVRVGVLSDGVDSLSALQSTGDLPFGVAVLSGQGGSGSEGTALLEIIHDLAPGADLLFATASIGPASFASNILALQAAGADVIVDDVGALEQSVFQDDFVASTIDSVTQAGVLYFSSAGNAGNLVSGTAGVWEGDFASSGEMLEGHEVHAFGNGITANPITLPTSLDYTLHWSDPNGGSGNDYDLLLVNASGAVVAASTDVQDGDDDPFEMLASGFGDSGGSLMIVRSPTASDRYLHLNANRGKLAIATRGQIGGHTAARGAFSIAAVDVGVGDRFDGSEVIQPFSSDGPRRVFFEADGSEITPGNRLATGGELRDKPDLSAADCVSTATPGFSTFCGTSASAAHAAAIAALLLDRDGDVTHEELRAALIGTALDIEVAGYDPDSGHGIVDAFAATEQVPEPAGTAPLVTGLALLLLIRRSHGRGVPLTRAIG